MVPTFTIHGNAQSGKPETVVVHGFMHYFYCDNPPSAIQTFVHDINAKIGYDAIIAAEVVMKRSIFGYNKNLLPYLKITVASNIKRVADIIIKTGRACYEHNIDITTRFMVDTGIVGGGWITCQKNNIPYTDITIIENTSLPNLKITSFDIECMARPNIFPNPTVDPIIQISVVSTSILNMNTQQKSVITLGSCNPIQDTTIIQCTSEEQLIKNFEDIIKTENPDIITGYNILGFDFPYIVNRAKQKHITLKLGRLGEICTIKETSFSSNQRGNTTSYTVETSGRIIFDMYTVISNDVSIKLRSYSLNSVSAEFLGEQKDDVPYSQIPILQNESPEGRKKIAKYCIKDAVLPIKLMSKLMTLYNFIEMARVTGVTISALLTRGQSIKVLSQIMRNAGQYIIPAYQPHRDIAAPYDGATVIQPLRGYYETPVATLDFASLYPSIMMAHNLCYSSLNIETGTFTTERPGLLPTILKDLINARKTAKLALKREQDPQKRAVLDGRQLALKVSANSVYGFTGAIIGSLPCIQISSTVTAYGREMIAKSKKMAEDHGHVVIYGDTDSIMVKLKDDPSVAQAIKTGASLANHISTTFKSPIKLEFEKVYCPYILLQKKRYAGLYWTSPDAYDKMDCKGIVVVRRDNCKLAVNVVNAILKELLINKNIAAAVDVAKHTVESVTKGECSWENLVITKQLKKETYAVEQPHSVLAKKLQQRGKRILVGQRIPFVITAPTSKKQKIATMAEDPLYAITNNLKINVNYYINNQLKSPISAILEPVIGSTRTMAIFPSTIHPTGPQNSPLLKFTTSHTSCLLCKSKTTPNSPVCKSCDISEAYIKTISSLSNIEQQHSRMWAHCQSCTNTIGTVNCANTDCPIFYSRITSKLKIKNHHAILNRFDW